ncbi:MAG: DUF5063 domain-containing protein [Prevotellaceae bacterium]|nr:DUF5063 domain-containing protein [Prevotellaceae bacterium]
MKHDTETVFDKNAIEFATVAVEFCLFLENAPSYSKADFVSKLLKILPLLYLKISMVETGEAMLDEEIEEFVSENEYELLRNQIAVLLGYSDRYLEVFTRDMQLSDEALASDISEDLADIYQDLKNFILRCRLELSEVMNDALVLCVAAFRDYWGQRLVNCLRALHNVRYGTELEENVDMNKEEFDHQRIKNNLFSQQRDGDDDALYNALAIV